MKLLFVTNNAHKLEEIKEKAGNEIELLGLQDAGIVEEIPESGKTLEKNASQKAWYVYKKYQMNCFADDTGLEIEALGGRPGVISARYAGENASFDENIEKVLKEMKDQRNPNARFRTVISLIINGKENQFSGEVKGKILKQKFGTRGFGYDPIFVPEGFQQTFAEMELAEKNKISHRARAFNKLIGFIKQLQ